MGTQRFAPVCLALAVACGGAEGDADVACELDTDGDGVADCDDTDDDDDGLSDEDEASAGTDPADRDSDRDGLSDYDELTIDRVYTPIGQTSTATTRTDPTTPSILVELDYAVGHRPSAATLTAAADAFAAAGIEAVFLVSDDAPIPASDLPATTAPWTAAEMEVLLQSSDDETDYLHVVIAPDDNTSKHGTTHYAIPNDPASGFGDAPPPEVSGSLVFSGTIAADHATFSAAFSAAGISEDLLVARTLIHEIGHLLGCTEEGPTNGFDTFNVMTQNSALGNPNSDIQPWIDSIFGLETVGHPTFATTSRAQMDLTFKASVDVATTPSVRSFDMGTSSSRVRSGYHRCTETSGFGSAGWGFLDPLPTVSSTAGSDPSDERFEDYVAGAAGVDEPTRFRITGLGSGEVGVFMRLGAQVSSPRQVRCEINHPERGTTSIGGTIDAANPFVATGSNGYRVYPVEVERTSLGYATSEVLIECLDDATHDDAPIETFVVMKREP